MSKSLVRLSLVKLSNEALELQALSGHEDTSVVAKQILAERKAAEEVVEDVSEPTGEIVPEESKDPEEESGEVVEKPKRGRKPAVKKD